MQGDIRDLGRVVLTAALLAGGCNSVLPGGFSNGGAGGTAAGLGGSPGTGGTFAADAGTSAPVCYGVAPRSPLIANFDDLTGNAFGVYGVDPVVGATNTQPPLLTQDFSQGNWHIRGTVPQVATSFVLYWKCPSLTIGSCSLDASQYLGIQFTLSGQGGPTSTLGLKVGRGEDEVSLSGTCGSCAAPSGGCQDPTTTINLSPAQGTQQYRVYWTQLAGGQPIDGIAPHAITSIVWTFPAAVSAAYDVDITIDDISFIPDIGP